MFTKPGHPLSIYYNILQPDKINIFQMATLPTFVPYT